MFVRLCVVASLLGPATALAADPVHNVISHEDPYALNDDDAGVSYDATDIKSSEALVSWQEKAEAFVHAVAVTNTGDEIEFRLVEVTGSDNDQIDGLFDVYKNGSLLCDDCIGSAYGLDQTAAAGNYFKLYVGTATAYAEDWLFAGVITDRHDY
ncbi:MAG: hypothetical protein KTR31_05160 [Myxococcales bacterium]|nr:hypothetical protein [Myxococcales bacterium]